MSREKERERGTLEVLELFSLSLRFSLFSWEHPPRPPSPPPSLLPPPSCSEAPLVHTLHSPPPPPLAPSACLPSLLPGGLGQCWRRSRDLQEICLSEKQLVRLSTANVCMLGPPPPPLLLGGARARPVLGTVGALPPCLPVILFICRPSSCSLSPSDDPVFSNSTSAAKVCVLIYHLTLLHLYILLSPKASPKSRVRL